MTKILQLPPSWFATATTAALMALAAPLSARAYQVQPLISHAKPTGANSTVRMVIKNTDPAPITLELSPFTLTVDDDGNETRTPDDGVLLIFPPQTVVPPNREQTVQIRYVGEAASRDDQIYGVLVSQLPIAFEQGSTSGEAKTDLKVGFNFRTYLIVDAPGGKQSLTASPVQRLPDGGLSFVVENSGNVVCLLHGVSWTFTAPGGGRVVLDSDHVHYGDFAAILPGHKRKVKVDAKDIPGLAGDVQIAMKIP